MNIIVLQGKQLITKEKLHSDLKEKLALPPYYGANLDALWDCLTGWIDVPTTVIWKDFEVSRVYLGQYAEATLETLLEAQAERKGLVVQVE